VSSIKKYRSNTAESRRGEPEGKNGNLNILLVFPEYPETFWSFKHAIKFVSKKSVHPPLGLLTVAAMLPGEWNKKVIDLNVQRLADKDVKWADYVFISAMTVQQKSVRAVIKQCNGLGTKIVAGGPLFTVNHKEYLGVDHFVLNEAEKTLSPFLEDLKHNRAKRIYSSAEFPDMERTPAPLYELINMKSYVSMDMQYSRGCPFHCDFCDITALYGRNVRTKTKEQVIAELDKLYSLGWRGNVFFVDDNFIGNKVKLKQIILPAIMDWMQKHKNPFVFSTEASINLADDEELMTMMVLAGFTGVFVGIETPEEDSLGECSKFQNKKRDLIESVKKLQSFGLEVVGGFIVGFDNDPPSIFKRQIDFIKESGIITAMVGLLNAPKNTKLYQRLQNEKRLLRDHTGDNTDFSINFVPKMEYKKLIEGYDNIIKGIYSCKPYYQRVLNFLKEKKKLLSLEKRHPLPKKQKNAGFKLCHISAFLKSIFILGLKDKGRLYYWKLLFWSLFRCPKLFPTAITFAIYCFHFRKIYST